MRYLIRALIFIGMLAAIELVVRYGLGVAHPAGRGAYWFSAVYLAFVAQMLINDLLAYFNVDGFEAYVVTDSDIPATAKEIPIYTRLGFLYPLFILVLCKFVHYFAYHAEGITSLRSPAP